LPENIVELRKLLNLDPRGEDFLEDALEHGISHNILNAKFHEKEAQIISEAGRKGAVTIATNMAGRGVDIILGGTVAPVEETSQPASLLSQPWDTMISGESPQAGEGSESFLTAQESDPEAEKLLSFRRGGSLRMQSLQEQEANKDHKERAEAVRSLSGLFIIGTERHESRRIDNQLRGRSGRQGDPGESRFFVSLEDELMRLFGDKSNNPMLAGWPEEQAIDSPIFTKLIERAQKKVEMHNFDIRKNVLEYDDVKNTQREVIYGQRKRVLQGADLRNTMVSYLNEVVEGELAVHAPESQTEDEWDLHDLYMKLGQIFPIQAYIPSPDGLKGMKHDELKEKLTAIADKAYDDKEASVTPEVMRNIERHWTLMVLDRHWMEHLSNMEYLQEGIGWRGMSGTSPVILFKKEAFEMFQGLLGGMQDQVIQLIFATQVQVQNAPPPPMTMVHGSVHSDPMGSDASDGQGSGSTTNGVVGASGSTTTTHPRAMAALSSPSEPKQSTPAGPARRLGRNDPCYCGSGKKFKNCHGG
jgi:preprotein translocase subunit SecA